MRILSRCLSRTGVFNYFVFSLSSRTVSFFSLFSLIIHSLSAYYHSMRYAPYTLLCMKYYNVHTIGLKIHYPASPISLTALIAPGDWLSPHYDPTFVGIFMPKTWYHCQSNCCGETFVVVRGLNSVWVDGGVSFPYLVCLCHSLWWHYHDNEGCTACIMLYL